MNAFELTRMARAFSGSNNVTVRLGGAGAIRTDLGNRTIYLPDTLASLGPEFGDVVQGALDHEVGHIIAEDEWPDCQPGALMEAMEDPLERFALNVAEDGRTERRSSDRWHGVKVHLDALYLWATGEIKAEADKGMASDFQLMVFGFALLVRGDELPEWFPKNMAGALAGTDLPQQVYDATSPETSRDLAKPIADFFRPYQLEDGELGQGMCTLHIHVMEGGEEGEGGEGCGHEGSVGACLLKRLSDLALSKAIGDDRRYIPHPRAAARDRFETAKKASANTRLVDKYVGGLATRMANLLRTDKPALRLDQNSGRLDRAALSSIRTGNTRVFFKEPDQEQIGAAVAVLIDGSGSMSGMKAEMASVAAYTIGEVLFRVGVPFEVLSWHDRDEEIRSTDEERALYTRFTSHRFTVYKAFGTAWNLGRNTLGSFEPDGWNDDGGALAQVFPRLLARKEKKKILIVLSDGQPNHPGSHGKPNGQELLNRHLVDALSAGEQVGIRIGCVGIFSEHVENFYRVNQVVNQLDALPDAVVDIFRRLSK